jgi:hypothetical protein
VIATASAAVCDFMSCAPRPHRKPSTTSPDHGSRDQSSGSASTVSTWLSRPSAGPSAPSSARSVATRFGALGVGAVELDLEAGLLQVALQPLLALALGARRVDGVELDEAAQDLGGLRLQRVGCGHVNSS